MALPKPLVPLRCNNPDCTLPEGGRCARLSEFPSPLEYCTDLARQSAEEPGSVTATAPWSGRHLDSAEVSRLLWRSPARLVAVLGPFNSGKTCLLTSFFLQLANGQRANFPYRFASSLTLYGFKELVERAGSWTGESGDTIVDHTVAGDDAPPRSFLHLGLRPEDVHDDRHIDLLLTDIPGEWVKAWGGVANEVTKRRMAFVSRCDAFIILSDANALLQPEGARTDTETTVLIRRVVKMAQDSNTRPPLALVFSKFDRIVKTLKPPPADKRADPQAWGQLAGQNRRRSWLALEEARRVGLPVGIFPTSSFPQPMTDGQPVGVMDPFTFVMAHIDGRERWPPREVPIPEGAHGFATMRRWRDAP